LQAGVINSITSSNPIVQLHGKSTIIPINIFHKCSQDELGPISFITQHIKSAAIYLLWTCAHVEAYQWSALWTAQY